MHKSALIIAALVAHGVWVEHSNFRLHRRNKKQREAATEMAQRMYELVGYLGSKLDSEEVELDEFDLIAIANI